MKTYPALARPWLAILIPLIILVCGLASLVKLPVAQYPELIPPSVTITALYPGASPQTLTDLVAAPLESAVSGLADVWHVLATSSASGVVTLKVTFRLGLDPEVALNRVNQRVRTANLPEETTRRGVTVNAGAGDLFQIVTLSSPDGLFDSLYLNDYISQNLLAPLRRIEGLASAELLIPEERAIRVWFDPVKLAAVELSVSDLITAIRQSNAQFAAGSFGLEPAPDGHGLTWLTEATAAGGRIEDFAEIIVKVGDRGQILRLGELAQIVDGAADYSVRARLNGQPVAGVSLSLTTGANALETAKSVRAVLDSRKDNFPPGVVYDIPNDVTVFVKLSIKEVITTLLEALVLVVLVIFLFLRNIKATIIPAVAVPVSIIGTLAGLSLLGFSINLLTLFAMVLSIGVVVDDAIVVLENAERLHREGLSPWRATNQAMAEVATPAIAIVLVLAAVFIPVSFVGGLTGEAFKQFGLTIALSVAISGLVALTLTPVMCVKFLGQGHIKFLKAFGDVVDCLLSIITEFYLKIARFFVKRTILALLVWLITLGGFLFLMKVLPEGLAPDEDQGYVIAMTQLPPGSSMPRTDKALSQLSEELARDERVDKVLSIAGLDLLGGTGSRGDTGVAFVVMKPWEERKGPQASSFALADSVFSQNFQLTEGFMLAFNPPPIVGLGSVGGLEGFLLAPLGTQPEELVEKGQFLSQAAQGHPILARLGLALSLGAPTIKLHLDVDKAQLMGVVPGDAFQTLLAGLSGSYVNDFIIKGRPYKVLLQAAAEFRQSPDGLDLHYVKNRAGQMTPLANLIREEVTVGPYSLDRFNGQPAARLAVRVAEGQSNLAAMGAIEELVKANLPGWSVGWSGSSYQEKVGGGVNYLALIFALILVYLILAIQYDSARLPMVALLSTPFALLGAGFTSLILRTANDLYAQVTLVTLIGLSVKNAILIIEFARMEILKGVPVAEAALLAAAKRFRPIIMTSLAFILGCLPLAMASGAGAASRQTLGAGLVGGMTLGTLLAPALAPGLLVLLMKGYKPKKAAEGNEEGGEGEKSAAAELTETTESTKLTEATK
ncbi:MAG: efflux RND transporter permease subunit [Deltaproteobacteria bacterium]|jgi:hydrophobe/amphiphile efflux-1 (HAE1) family protein|nr:efflux RND transporter permease subunit [Deltaproteobacteria bacterium]